MQSEVFRNRLVKLSFKSQVTPEALTYRLFELRWTLYKLAKQYSATVGTNSPASRYHTSLGKVLANPNKSSLKTIKTVVVLSFEVV